ncbi:hypothetical protein NCS55_01354700 [Fusarium keratoplasticum]|nr:hypothetical protein NCS55_01354700 [Fusarium keratoplasticum]
MDDVVSYPIADSEQAFLDSSILPGASEFVGYAPIDSEPQNPRSDQDGVDNVDTSITSEPLPGMVLDSLALVDLPSLSFYAFDFTSSLPYPSTNMPRNHPRSALSPPTQISPEVTQFEEGCQSESTGGPPSQQIHDHVVPPKPYVFPDVQSDQLQASFSGIYCHIPHTNLLQQAHQKASEFFYSIHDHQELTGALVPTFLPFSAFNAFIQLYFEHFHPSWPFIHPSALAQPDTSWILHVGIAAVGARYATADTMELYMSAMLVLHRDAILQNRPKSPKEGELTFSQSVLLHHISLAFGGSQPQLTNMCFERSILTTLCHNRITTMTWLPDDAQPASADGLRWETWVATQSNYWLIYSAWLFECLSQIFFGMRPLMNLEDIDVPLPEQGSAWSAVTRSDWESVLGKRPGGQASKKSLKKVLYDADSMQEIVPEADGFLRLLFTATLDIESLITGTQPDPNSTIPRKRHAFSPSESPQGYGR